MLFSTKKDKIRKYLNQKEELSVFDELAADYISGCIENFFAQNGLNKIEIHVDWLNNYKCIDFQARLDNDFIIIMIEEDVFSIGIDPDDAIQVLENHLYSTKEDFYSFCIDTINSYLKQDF